MAEFTIKKLCEDINATLEKWFKGYPDDENCPLIAYGIEDLLNEWNKELEKYLRKTPSILHEPWYEILLSDPDGNERELVFEVKMTDEHPMSEFFLEGVGFEYALGKFVYDTYMEQNSDDQTEEPTAKLVCAGLNYDDCGDLLAHTLDDVIRWVESEINDRYKEACIIDKYMGDHAPEETETFITALSSMFSVYWKQISLHDLANPNWRLAFITAWENA